MSRPLCRDISVVIPTWNEAHSIAATLRHLTKTGAPREIIVSDGGSSDGTLDIVQGLPLLGETVVRGLSSPTRGRGAQMNFGAQHAHGEHLLFLHADTKPSPGWDATACYALSQPRVAACFFRYAVDAQGLGFRILEVGTNLRVALFRLPYGDQGFCLRRETFSQVGGFFERPLMEDVDLLRRLRSVGRVVEAQGTAVTSARRFQKEGLAKTIVKDWVLVAAFRLGVAPELLRRFYQFGNRPTQ
jgi:rSAM/selenodomain-associated transferase 2